MKKPAEIVYGVGDKPPIAIAALSAVQQAAVMVVYLIFPLIVCRAAGSSIATTNAVISLAMLVLGLATLLQAAQFPGVGSGYLCPPVFSATYIDSAMSAVSLGGLPLMFGMTAFAGLAESGLSRVLHRLRPTFPPEVAGLVVMLVGLSNAGVGVGDIMSQLNSTDGGAALAVAAASLGSMVVLNVWTRGATRILCTLIGIAVGYVLAFQLGLFRQNMFGPEYRFAIFSVPNISYLRWKFNIVLVIPFFVSALASALKAMATLTLCQKINDEDWIRPDLNNLRCGVAADGLGTVLAGMLGTFGLNSSPTCVGLSTASGVTSRYVAYLIAGFFVVAGFFPGIAMVLAVMPKPVIAAALLFTSCFLLISGMQTVTSRMLDSRKTFVVGLTIIGGLAVEMFPGVANDAPAIMKPILGSSLVFGTLLAFVLNIVFRIGIKQRVELVCQAGGNAIVGIDDFLEENGAKWGARRDIVDRARFAMHQTIETIIHDLKVRTPIRVQATFDEFNLDVAVLYDGELLELPQDRPSNDEIIDSEHGVRRLAGFMLQRIADRARSERTGGKSVLRFHFDH